MLAGLLSSLLWCQPALSASKRKAAQMARVKWSDQALKDVEDISKYIEKVSLQYTKEQARTIYEKAKQLENYPLSGRPVPELKIHTIRQVLCGTYRIIYEVESENDLVILTVHHQSRLIENNPTLKDKKIRRLNNLSLHIQIQQFPFQHICQLHYRFVVPFACFTHFCWKK